MRVATVNVYTFDELSETSKETALNSLADINLMYDWWISVYEDAEQIGCKIEGFDIDGRGYCNISLLKYAEDVAKLIQENHGSETSSYLVATEFLNKQEKAKDNFVASLSNDIDNLDYFLDKNAAEFEVDLSRIYLKLLRSEYDYLTSEAAIIEIIKANESEFTVDGKPFYL